jgi:hypothetical protein
VLAPFAGAIRAKFADTACGIRWSPSCEQINNRRNDQPLVWSSAGASGARAAIFLIGISTGYVELKIDMLLRSVGRREAWPVRRNLHGADGKT